MQRLLITVLILSNLFLIQGQQEVVQDPSKAQEEQEWNELKQKLKDQIDQKGPLSWALLGLQVIPDVVSAISQAFDRTATQQNKAI